MKYRGCNYPFYKDSTKTYCGLILDSKESKNKIFLGKIKGFKFINKDAYINIQLGLITEDFRLGRMDLEKVYVYETPPNLSGPNEILAEDIETLSTSLIDDLNHKYKNRYLKVNLNTKDSKNEILELFNERLQKKNISLQEIEAIQYYQDYWNRCPDQLDSFENAISKPDFISFIKHSLNRSLNEKYKNCIPEIIPTLEILPLLQN